MAEQSTLVTHFRNFFKQLAGANLRTRKSQNCDKSTVVISPNTYLIHFKKIHKLFTNKYTIYDIIQENIIYI